MGRTHHQPARQHPRQTPARSLPGMRKKTVYRRDNAGDLVRQPALQITTQGCVCQHCRTVWGPERFMLLAKVLGYDLPPGVLE
ncbi:putative phage protein [Mycobacterium xenopi 3993]|nr:putative phage protein [Mycobacterium xenopi 3993]